jgi:hydrogenase maturation factor HypE
MGTMFRASNIIFDSIELVEVIRETDNSVWFINKHGKQVRENKESNYASFHKTKGEAKKYMISKYREKIESAKRQIDSYKSKISKIEKL